MKPNVRWTFAVRRTPEGLEIRWMGAALKLNIDREDYSVHPCTPPLRGRRRYTPTFRIVPDDSVVPLYDLRSEFHILTYPNK